MIELSANATFGDASWTEGGRHRQYVLAQFRGDANLEWLHELRAATVSQIKYKNFASDWRHRIKESNQPLWRRVENGVGQASLFVVDPRPVAREVEERFRVRGHSLDAEDGERRVAEECAAALIAGTPIAYLGQSLAMTIPGFHSEHAAIAFTPAAIQKAVGSSLRHAKIFTARAHAIFDVPRLDDLPSTIHVYRSPLGADILAELLLTARAYDNEHPPSINVLNAAVASIADAMKSSRDESDESAPDSPIIWEANSGAFDHLQAADLAAGWARDLLDTSDPRVLGTRFERVWLNGTRIK